MTDTNETPLRSPCVSICALDENNVCLGCYRTGQEITDWGSMTNDQRREVMQLVGERERAAMNFFSVDTSAE
ncbi:MAG: DUF1289 domain-containing protein [Thalassolituus maritimus]|uniref:DUF1289 domain-containing protein n=1 Tax=Thalassolituus maritimus TaxID=484498 RepID=A0A1N7KTA3_9GAMM|nr:DUF1289 domain-containing protein [Thalassolituus maritimus]TPD55857.1 MAG: DUF1289 domain-containing protein [Thalassolituus maritimus]SIS64794.1 hypothetical protein SAMN05421686_10380 [Thalassolituus maritimus]